MQIKTFRALDMRDALRAVKEELGPEAVILSTREVKSGGGAFGLFSRAVVEVTAAIDRGGARQSERGSWDPLQSKATGAPTSPLRSAPGGRGSVSADPGREGEIAGGWTTGKAAVSADAGLGGWNEAARAPGARGRDERDETRFRDQYRNDVHEDRGAILSHGRLVRDWENLQDSRRQEPPFSERLQDAGGLQAIREDMTMIKEELRNLRRPIGPPSAER